MKKLSVVFLLMVVMAVSSVQAGSAGAISTDRFGYTGSVVRYGSLADAQSGSNPIGEIISVDNRDLSVGIVNDYADYSGDMNVLMGSWWYTTNTQFSATQGSAGWGNTTGNTGVGFIQLYDADSSTDTSLDMTFSNYDGTHYTQFDLAISGVNAGADDYSRFSAIDNVNDGGIWHEYNMMLTATGLEGVASGGIIEAFNHPTGVSGSITGIFELTENQTTPANQGFYTVNLTLNMTNWAFDNQASLTPEISMDGGNSFFDGTFADSYFATVPEPMTLGILSLGGLFLRKRK